MNYCLATHPDKPDYSLNSRGRKYHLTIDKKSTLCNMIVTQLIGSREEVYGKGSVPRDNGLHWSPTQFFQGPCGNCTKTAKERAIPYKLMEY
jgi:hypothetical protein